MNPDLQSILDVLGRNEVQFTSLTPRRVTINNVINNEAITKASKPETLKDRANIAADLAHKLVGIAVAREKLTTELNEVLALKGNLVTEVQKLQKAIDGYEVDIQALIGQKDKLLSDYEDVAKELGAVRLT